MEKLRSTEFPDYSNQACVNDAYQGFVSKFLHVVDSVAPIKTRRVKSSIKPRFDIDVLNATRNRDKHYKRFKQSGKEIDKEKFKKARFLLKKIIYNNRKL